MTQKQAEYQAGRRARREYRRVMRAAGGPGRQADRIDIAQSNANMAWAVALREYGAEVTPIIEWPGYCSGLC